MNNRKAAQQHKTKQRISMLAQQRRFSEAMALCEDACRNAPEDVDAWLLHASLLVHSGNVDHAGPIIAHAIQLAPENSLACYTAGTLYQASGNIAAAMAAYARALELNPKHAESLCNLGMLYRSTNRLEDALQSLGEAAKLLPDHPLVLNNIGLVQKDIGRLDEAVATFDRLLAQQPDYADAHLNLGNVLQLSGDSKKAERHYRLALEKKPAFPAALVSLGQILTSRGEFEQALALFNKALSIQPDFRDAVAAIAATHEKAGDYQAAYDTLAPAVHAHSASPGMLTIFGTVCRRLGLQAKAIELLEHAIASPGLSATQTKELRFCVANLYDDTHRHDDAFRHFSQANKLCAPLYDRDTTHRQFSEIARVFSQSGLQTFSTASNRSELPIFIVGMPRSGTSLIEQILASHPLVFGGGELEHLGELLNSFPQRFGPQRGYPSVAADLDSHQLDLLAEEYLRKLGESCRNATRITDKMPHNFLHLGLIQQLFPRARVIHCRRDPMDTCLSIFFHNFNAKHAYASDLFALGDYYNQYLALMAHWEQTLELPILHVDYETLVNNQEEKTAELLDFCGLEWSDSCLRFHESERRANTPSYDQVRKPLYTSSISRWEAYAEHLSPLRQALG